MGIGEVLVTIVGIGAATATIIVYLVMRADVLKRHGVGADPGTRQAIEALRDEIAALRQHEAEAVLSFDSTLQTLNARLEHLERRALGERTETAAALGPATGRATEEPAVRTRA
jgi:hypothetical protein